MSSPSSPSPTPSVGSHLIFGAHCSQGGREYQEDRLVAINNMNQFMNSAENISSSIGSSSSRSYFACFDGHGGAAASEFLASKMHLALASHENLQRQPLLAFQRTWVDMDNKLLNEFQSAFKNGSQHFPQDGSTGTVCLVIDDQVYIANCGDSSAYACYEDGFLERLTDMHGTENADEIKRILAANGQLRDQKAYSPLPFPLCCIRCKGKVGKQRVYPGGLLVTRAFGDFYAKLENLGGKPDVVICNYDNVKLISFNSSKHGKLKYIIIGSDGVWDALSATEVFAVVNSSSNNNNVSSDSNQSSNINSNSNSSNSDSIDPSCMSGETVQKGYVPISNRSFISPKAVVPMTAETGTDTAPMLPRREVADGIISAEEEEKKKKESSFIKHDGHLNANLSFKAKLLCEAAIKSKYWKELSAPADNTSCILVQINH